MHTKPTHTDICAYHAFYSTTQGDIKKEKDALFEGVFSDIVDQLSVPQQQAIIRAKDMRRCPCGSLSLPLLNITLTFLQLSFVMLWFFGIRSLC